MVSGIKHGSSTWKATALCLYCIQALSSAFKTELHSLQLILIQFWKQGHLLMIPCHTPSAELTCFASPLLPLPKCQHATWSHFGQNGEGKKKKERLAQVMLPVAATETNAYKGFIFPMNLKCPCRSCNQLYLCWWSKKESNHCANRQIYKEKLHNIILLNYPNLTA